MDAGFLQRADRILAEALERPAAEREALIARRCDGDAPLLAMVRRLLARTGDDDGFERPLQHSGAGRRALDALTQVDSVLPGQRIGAWQVVRRIGLGGSAEVFLGERSHDGIVQQAAIKLLHADAADPAAAARFNQEQQILARLHHPDIASIFDVGLARDGRPYFVMELVHGVPIDRYCDDVAADVAQRVRLVARVAGAVAHAHAALVVHRDIKPANVLVDAAGHPKLMDFGIAKRIDDGGGAELTRADASPATFGYASPEQLAGAPVGVASDVYQLGMLLYVLLAGQRPFATRGLGRDEAAALLRDAEVPAPSRRLRGNADDRLRAIARQRRVSVRQLLRGIDGDLDRIVLKALASDPRARYASVAQFAADLDNHLAGRPVTAREPSFAYLLSRTLRRHALLSTLAGVLLLGLVVFSLVVATLAWRLDAARLRAERQATQAEQVLDYLVGTFRAVEPERSGGRGSIVKAALDRAAASPPAQFEQDAALRVRFHLLLGKGYDSLAEYPDGERQYRAALDATAALDRFERRTAEYEALLGLGRARMRDGDRNAALAYFEQLVDGAEDDPDARLLQLAALGNIASIHAQNGDLVGARATVREVIDGHRRLLGAEHPTTLRAEFADVQYLTGDGRNAPRVQLQEAAALLETLEPRVRRAYGETDTFAWTVRLLQLRVLAFLGRSEAFGALHATLAQAAQQLGVHHLFVLNTRRAFAVALAQAGQHAEAQREADAAVAGIEARYSPGHADREPAHIDRAIVLLLAGRRDEAIDELLQTRPAADLLQAEPLLAPLRDDVRVRSLFDPQRPDAGLTYGLHGLQD